MKNWVDVGSIWEIWLEKSLISLCLSPYHHSGVSFFCVCQFYFHENPQCSSFFCGRLNLWMEINIFTYPFLVYVMLSLDSCLSSVLENSRLENCFFEYSLYSLLSLYPFRKYVRMTHSIHHVSFCFVLNKGTILY